MTHLTLEPRHNPVHDWVWDKRELSVSGPGEEGRSRITRYIWDLRPELLGFGCQFNFVVDSCTRFLVSGVASEFIAVHKALFIRGIPQ